MKLAIGTDQGVHIASSVFKAHVFGSSGGRSGNARIFKAAPLLIGYFNSNRSV